jgi:hypothetical protein
MTKAPPIVSIGDFLPNGISGCVDAEFKSAAPIEKIKPGVSEYFAVWLPNIFVDVLNLFQEN